MSQPDIHLHHYNNNSPHHHHNEEHFTSSEIIRDLVIGMSDGLTVPFALAAGISGVVENTQLVIIAGLAEIAAGSIAMGLGGFLAGKTEVQHYNSELKREYDEVERVPEVEKHEICEMLAEYGISPNTQQLVANELANNKDKWVNFMMKYELGLEPPNKNRAIQSAGIIAIAYVVGGLIPLSAYFFVDDVQQGLIISSILTLICLFVFGYFKSKITGQPPFKGAINVTAIGAAAAGAAYCIARWLGQA